MRKKIALRLLHLFSLLPSTLAAMVCYDIISPMHPEVLTPVDCWPASLHSSSIKRGMNKGLFPREIQAKEARAQILSPLDPRAGPAFGPRSDLDSSGQKGVAKNSPSIGRRSSLDPSSKNKPSIGKAETSARQQKAIPESDRDKVQNSPAPAPQTNSDSIKSPPSPKVSPQSLQLSPQSPPSANAALAPPPPSNPRSSLPLPSPLLGPPNESAESSSSSPKSGSKQPPSSSAYFSVDKESTCDNEQDGSGDGGPTLKGHNDDNRDDHSQYNAPEEANLPFFDFAPDSPLNEILSAPALPPPSWSSDQQIFFNLACNQGSFDACHAMSQTLDLAGWYVSQVTAYVSMF